MTDLQHRLDSLPPAIAEPLRRAIEFSWGDPEARNWQEQERYWNEAMTAAGFVPSMESQVAREIPLASDLDPTQRLVAEAIAVTPGMPVAGWPIYAASWLARQWLGIDPPGVAFVDIDFELDGQPVRWPRLHVLRHLLRNEQSDSAWDLLRALPVADRVEMLAIFELAHLDIECLPLSEWLEETSLEVIDAEPGDEAGWATRIADWALALYDGPYLGTERPQGPAVPELVARLLLAAMVGAGEPVEPRHDVLLRLAWGDFEPMTLRCVAAIPEARREAAMIAALEQELFDNDKVRVGLIFLERYPYPGFARAALQHLEEVDNPKQALAKFEALAKRHPELVSALEANREALANVPVLHVAEIIEPVTLDDLDDVRRCQLEIANRLYAGDESSAEQILSRKDGDREEGISPSFLELRLIEDSEGKPAYDAWLYMVDSGTIFEAGTENVVAEVIQFGLETEDRMLRLALPPAIDPVRGPAKKKPAAKQKLGKK